MDITNYFYTEQQVSAHLGLSRVTIWRWMKDGRFNIQRVGREVLIPKWEIELLKEYRNKNIKI